MNFHTLLVAIWNNVSAASLEGAALIVVVMLLQLLLKRPLGPSWSFTLWFVVLLRLSLPILPASSWTWPRPIEALRLHIFGMPPLIPSVPAAAAGTSSPSSPTRTSSDLTPASPPIQGFGPHRGQTLGGPSGLAIGVAMIWAVGALILAVRHWLGIRTYRRNVRHWPLVTDSRIVQLANQCRRAMRVARPVEMRAAPDLETPCLFGIFEPVILLPVKLLGALTDLEWRNILLHEFAHLRRRDPVSNAWMSGVGIFHWFNPLVWWAIRRMREDRELACDQLVLARADIETGQSYGATLLKLAGYPVTAAPSVGLGRVGILEGTGLLKARLLALRARPVVWLNAVLGVGALTLLGSCVLTRNPDTSDMAMIYPVNLNGYTDFPRRAQDPSALQRYQDDPGMWSQIPHGREMFFGVPFDITGLVRLAGTTPQRLNEWYFRPRVDGIPIGRAFERLYLLHTTFYYEQPGKVVARVRLHYSDGTSAEIPIAYGTHTLNYWRQRYENTSQLTDSDSRVAWTGPAPPGVAEYGNSLRLIVSSFKNPHPKRVVQTVDLISTWSDSAAVIAGMAVGGRTLPKVWSDNLIVQYPKNDWRGLLRFRAVDAATGKPIPKMELRLEVAEPGVHSRIGTYYTGIDGWVALKYPHTDFNYITIWADHPGYVPRLVQWTRKQHGPFPREYVYRAEPGIRIHGRIVDAQGAPVADALVRINGPAPNFDGDGTEFLTMDHSYAKSDTDGRWSSAEVPKELPADRIRLRVLHPGFAPSASQRLTAEETRGAEIETRLVKRIE